MAVMVQPSLYEVFEKACVQEHRTVSEVIRELMSKYSQGWIQSPKNQVVFGESNTIECPLTGIKHKDICLENNVGHRCNC